MANFDYLAFRPEYKLFSSACIEAEKVFHSSPAMCAIGCRKALELGVKWIYAAENMPLVSDKLQILIHEDGFYFTLDKATWNLLPYIIKLGNTAVHSEVIISAQEAQNSLRNLFRFVDWIDYTYAEEYVPRTFDPAQIPTAIVQIDTEKVKKQESLLAENAETIARLQAELNAKSEELARIKEENHRRRPEYITPEELDEFQTRKLYIDLDLKALGWQFDGQQVREEYPLDNMAGVPGKANGFADYVLFGQDGRPLAIIEAKKTTKDPRTGKTQAMYYADSLEQKFGVRPVIFLSNGLETWYWDQEMGPERRVGGLFSRADLERLISRHGNLKDLEQVPISNAITNRPYQKEAIRACCEHFEAGFRKSLLVMATGTGKTRTAASLVDVLSRGGYVTNVLFLADRTALVKQAKEAFHNYLPEMSLCNLLDNKDDIGARIVFSTYPTMLNAIDFGKDNGLPLFTPGHFDLIIIDESHRSIFKKYRAIFDYFDAMLIGLTATPKTDVDKNTYDFFECASGVPTYAYDYDTAVYTDKVLVPYYCIKVKTAILEEGIKWDELSEEDRESLESSFAEDEEVPEEIPACLINRLVFNQTTVDMVLQDLMEKGIKVAGGDRIAKTIIFAKNMNHAKYIVERFNKLYPMYGGTFCQWVGCQDTYAQKIIDDFKFPSPPSPWSAEMEKRPQIVVSVDMMDTGIDVPHVGNLVFFKQVFSKTKFWQMIGRGTRLCPNMECVDGQNGEYIGKKYFYIFDYCGNFDFFSENPNGRDGADSVSLSQAIFIKRVKIIYKLQEEEYQTEEMQELRQKLIAACHEQIASLNPELATVKVYRVHVEAYRDIHAFDVLDDDKMQTLIRHLSSLVALDDEDEYAKRYDNAIYGIMLDALDGGKDLKKVSSKLCATSELLKLKSSIAQIAKKLPVINATADPQYWSDSSIVDYEHVRQELRDLIQFLSDINRHPPIFTNVSDEVTERREGEVLPPSEDFVDYKTKVNRYVIEHSDTIAIYKLTHNLPLTDGDFKALENILFQELGSREDYKKEFGDTPFGIMIRRAVGMDHEAVMKAFSEFIDQEHLNSQQMHFVNRVISYVERNGWVQDVSMLLKPPFDKPSNFFILFDEAKQKHLWKTIQQIGGNARRMA